MQLDASADLRAVVLSQAIPDEYREMFAMVGDSANVLDLLDDMLLRADPWIMRPMTATSKTGLVEHLWLAKPRGEWTSADLLKRIDLAIVSPDQLDAWLTYDLERRRATGPLILGLVAAAETGGMPPDHLVLALDYLVFDRAARAALDLFPVLRQHNGRSLDDLVQPFADLDEEVMEARRTRSPLACVRSLSPEVFHRVGLET